MQSTLVGLFDTQGEADQARAKLIAAGFDASASSVHPESGSLGSGGSATGLAAGSSAGTTTGTTNSMTGQPAAEHEGVVSRFFHRLFGSDDDDVVGQSHSSTYREAFRRGAYAVTVDANSDAEIDRAEAILNACGAVDIDERSAKWRSEGWTGQAASGSYASDAASGDRSTAYGTTGTPNDSGAGARVDDATLGATAAGGLTGARVNEGGDLVGTTGRSDLASAGLTGDRQTLNVVQEELQVGKRVVSRGGVRVFSRIVEVPVEESVNLTEEHATIVRRPTDRPATESDLTAFQEGTMEVRDTAEEVVVAKNARVVEEVEIGKEVTHRDEKVRDTVRRTEVDVERVPADSTTGTASTTTTGTPSTGGTPTSKTGGL